MFKKSYLVIPDEYDIIKYNDIPNSKKNIVFESIYYYLQKYGTKLLKEKEYLNLENVITKNSVYFFCGPIFLGYEKNYIEKKLSLTKGLKVYLSFDDEFFFLITNYYSQFMDLTLTTDVLNSLKLRMMNNHSYHWFYPIYEFEQIKYNNDFKYDICFIGNLDPKKTVHRKIFIEKILSRFSNYKIYISDSDRLSLKDMYYIFNSTKININLSQISDFFYFQDTLTKYIRGSKARPYEIIASKGFCISENSESLNKQFTQLVPTFNSDEEGLDLIERYLKNDNLRNEILKKQYNHFKKNFSIYGSNKLLDVIFNENKNKTKQNDEKKIHSFIFVEKLRLKKLLSKKKYLSALFCLFYIFTCFLNRRKI